MKRFSTISAFPGSMEIIDFDYPEKEFGSYIVDDSSFVPMSEAVKRVTGGTLSSEQIRSLYDFKDGKDTGVKIPVDRSHRFTGDIAEISENLRESSENVKAALEKSRDEFDFKVVSGQIDVSAAASSSSSSKE